MILNCSVCDHCGNQTYFSSEPAENDGFEFWFCKMTIQEKAKENKPWVQKMRSSTFCNKNCLIEYFKSKLDMKGNVIDEAQGS